KGLGHFLNRVTKLHRRFHSRVNLIRNGRRHIRCKTSLETRNTLLAEPFEHTRPTATDSLRRHNGLTRCNHHMVLICTRKTWYNAAVLHAIGALKTPPVCVSQGLFLP